MVHYRHDSCQSCLLQIFKEPLDHAVGIFHLQANELATFECILARTLNRGSYMRADVLLNLLNKLGKRDKVQGLLSILSRFRNEFNKFNKT